MEGTPINNPGDIPVYIQALLNLIAFLIAAVAVWYAYFVKGKDKASGTADLPDIISSFDARVWRGMGEDFKRLTKDVNRLATAAEKIEAVLQHDSTEAEIERRVKEQLRAKQARGER